MKRWRGLKDLVQDAVDSGASALERVQKQAAATPFRLLEKVPPFEAPATRVHALHDAAVGGVYGMVRWVNRTVGAALDGVLDVLEARRQREDARP